MPHQLRRIIAINIRNATTGLPSEVVAEMDPRGSILAVGVNGAGKTTFLRLLPLFYGATPQQILRGSGKSSLIAYSLPSASSAVAFEYERENATDLRCVVMHCEAGEDRPVFRIIENGGFKEEYFYDDEGYFVTREEFPARAERLGAQLTQKLPLNLYRSVILKERLHTKEGQRVRDLAERHSLGARALTNLDQIAAAMANEKISFADLRNIVIDRVSDIGAADRPNVNARELRKSRKDVVKWIEDLDHLNRVMAQAPFAQTVKATIERVGGHHLRMCSLHLAVKEALRQAEAGQLALEAEELIARQKMESEGAGIQEALSARASELADAVTKRDLAGSAFATAQSRLEHFTAIEVMAMASRQDQEEEFKALKVGAEKELAKLTVGAGEVQESAAVRRSVIEQEVARQYESISSRELKAAQDVAARLAANHLEEAAALAGMVTPSRLAEVAGLREVNVSRLGELKAVIKSPAASAEAQETLRTAHEDMRRLVDEHADALGQTYAAAAIVEAARGRLMEAVSLVDRANAAHMRAGEAVEQLQSHLTPAPGSLLEYLRKNEPGSWAGVARVIDPGLLDRTDLFPDENALETGDPASVIVGPLILDVRNVAQPTWVDMTQLRDRIAKAKDQMASAMTDLGTAKNEAASAQKAHKEAAAAHSSKQAAEALLLVAKTNATSAHGRLTNVVNQEAALCKQAAMIEQGRLVGENLAFDTEVSQINAKMAQSLKAIRDSFETQRKELGDEAKVAAAFNAERDRVKRRQDADITQLEMDMAAKLQGMGIDPNRILELGTTVRELGGRLNSIAENRHLVYQWREFERDVLPRMEVLRINAQEAMDAVTQIEAALSRAREAEREFTQRQTATARQFAERAEKLTREAAALDALLKSSLKDYLTRSVQPTVETDWDVRQLERDVQLCKQTLADDTDKLTTQARRLRDVMTEHDSPVTHWIAQRERELADPMTLLDHEVRTTRAQVLCDWFLPGEEARVSYFTQVNQEMDGFLAVAGNFVQDLDIFESRIRSFNKDLQAALKTVSGFRRFKDLTVEVLSSMGQIGAIGTLRQMQQVLDSKTSSYGAFSVRRRDLPSIEEVALIRRFREILPADGVLRINLNEQVRLECGLTEGGQRRVISNDEEFRAVSSTGNTALIVAMFLIGFLEMVRKKDSGVRMTWLTDECGRFDPGNLREFLHVLDAHSIDVISAAPSADPAQARFFHRLCMFEDSGAIVTTENGTHFSVEQGGDDVRA